MALEGEFPKIDGDVLFDGDVNSMGINQLIYTGVGYDSSQSGAGTNEDNEELTAIGASQAKYAIIKATFTSRVTISGTTTNLVEYKIQVKETGQSYGDVLPYTIVLQHGNPAGSGSNPDHRNTQTIVFVHTLTAGEKTNGFQVNVFSKSTVGSGSTASFTNIQTTVELAQGI